METFKQFVNALVDKLHDAEDRGDVLKSNEITANLMVGAMILVIALLSFICLGFNEVGVFTADKVSMRISTVISIVVAVTCSGINQHYRGDRPWLKNFLMLGLVAQCGGAACYLGQNVALIMAIPVLLSIRYCDARYVNATAIITVLSFLIATIVCTFKGIMNLNAYKVPVGTILYVDSSLRDAVKGTITDNGEYLKEMLLNDFLPRFMVFTIIGIASNRIASRARAVLELQDRISKKNARIETELNLAKVIQTSMLPCIYPAFPEIKDIEIYATNAPAKEVGGDFYDYFKVDEDHIAIVMADVSGKGVGAALFMMIAKTILKNNIQSGLDIARAVELTNRQLCENNTAELFVTVWAGVYELSTSTLYHVNAGHNPPIIIKKGICSYLNEKHSLVLGAFDRTSYECVSLHLEPGDEIILYTDGVTEATDCKDQLYGEDRLLACAKSIANKGAKQQISDILNDVGMFVKNAEQFDDITVLVMKILNN